MMKISFKENAKKVQTFNNQAIIVTLTGKVLLPNNLSNCMPIEVCNWVESHPSVDANEIYSIEGTYYILKVSGKAVCSDTDDFNPIIGERIAESRAKIKLYKFMVTLCNKLRRYYHKIQYGKGAVSYHVDHSDLSSWGLLGNQYKYDSLLTNEQMHLNKLLLES